MAQLFTVNNEQNILICFNTDDISDTSRIKKAYIILECDRKLDLTKKLSLNSSMDSFNLDNKRAETGLNTDKSLYELYKNYIDITEDFHLIVSGVVENNGFILNRSNLKKASFKLYFTYIENIIIPDFRECSFSEEDFIFSSFEGIIISPWFLTKDTRVVSFYIKNLSREDITINVQTSPNAKDFVNDTKSKIISPAHTTIIAPGVFSKYARIVIHSNYKPIVSKVWFQAQSYK